MAFVIDNSVEIEAPAELVWQVLTDVDNYGDWNPFVIECKTTLEPGSPIDMRVRLIGPSPRKQREFIATNTPGKEFSYNMKPAPLGLLSSKRTHTLTPLGDGRTRYDSHFELNGPVSPLVATLMGSALHKGFGGMTAGVKLRAESLREPVSD
ncbi:SRPBCC domain-containing protein [Nocardia sp. NBC_00511]|uniref:SRPBCC domain-containing protein n=1 Tax=Nocardia sp. NBC_00511 TaxID=2903591 RepID=UPI0030E2DB55